MSESDINLGQMESSFDIEQGNSSASFMYSEEPSVSPGDDGSRNQNIILARNLQKKIYLSDKNRQEEDEDNKSVTDPSNINQRLFQLFRKSDEKLNPDRIEQENGQFLNMINNMKEAGKESN